MLGKTLGQYRVDSKLGEGGMGVVYEGTDTRLGRTVAIKVLHASVVRDAERMARFEREARILAALNHPNIAAIHGLEESDGTKFLVLEYVPGETLDERIARGPVPLKEALEICRQISEGLEAAHEKGIIHRDLKPANVKITPAGIVKVLDFGLAKAAEAASPPDSQGGTATFAFEMTQPGLVMGTPAYMSPEQACGKPVDRRTDIWAFGCVLYEMLTRKLTFAGETMTEMLAAVLDKDPDWGALPATVPENVKHMLRRCLEKNRRFRLRDIGDARLELEDTLAGRATTAIAALPPKTRTRRMIAGALGGLVLFGSAVGIGSWLRSRRVPAPEIVRFTHPLPPGQRMTPGWNPSLIFSPDGESVAFNYEVDGITTAFQRPIRELDQKPLGGVKSLGAPVYSPDGRWVVMVDMMDQALKKIAIDGGAPVPLTGTDMFGRGDWGKDGYIYFTERYPGAIQRIPENGGP
ncbi:MAG: serine/threonine-protein kinase [Candidatus Aminicenantes bacterium]|nr:serine/threonine-protein kinase [Candidatus Aminicenantes bacterium]